MSFKVCLLFTWKATLLPFILHNVLEDDWFTSLKLRHYKHMALLILVT